MITTSLLNFDMVKISILILFVMCMILIGLVLGLAISLWKLREKLITEKNRTSDLLNNKHYLTSLAGRHALMEMLENLLEANRKLESKIALLFIDLDDFNNINCSLGVRQGDLLLQRVAERIVNSVCAFSKFVYHIGSDEFAVILFDYGTDTESIADLANDIINSVSQPVNLQGYNLQVSCCIGVCEYPMCASDADGLIKHAGAARDNAKKIGYGTYVFYTEEMSKKSVMRALISADLRYALERNELILHYQPKVYLSSGKVQGAEALLRWHHPTLGNIPPEVFVPIMEDLGLIHSIGKWVINTACRDFSKLHKDGYKDLHIAINVSPHQFDKGDIASIIAEAIWETGIAPHNVELELTEEVVMSDTEKSSLMLKVLQSMGVRIAIDDFGTGYSSMNQLTRFPVNILKVDRCFIQDMHIIPANRAIVSTIIRMAQQLNFQVVAEGVECIEELDILRAENCDLIQGFYFSKPLPLSEFIKYLQTNATTSDTDILSAEQSA